MNQSQHIKLAMHYRKRYAEIAGYSRSVNGKLTRQQALDYAAMWAKYALHNRCARSVITAEELDSNVTFWASLKDTRQCRFVYQGDYVEGIGEFNGGYYIEYGGIVNYHRLKVGGLQLTQPVFLRVCWSRAAY